MNDIEKFAAAWLSKFLDIGLPNVPLEDLLVNCWLLGRVADYANALLVGKRYALPPSYLPQGHRPSKQVISDIERFQRLCDMLDIDENTQISLADLEHKDATRAALCIWDVADALKRSGFEGVPSFASPEERAQFRRVGSHSNADKVQQFDSKNSPLKLPYNPHLIPGAEAINSDGTNPPSLNRWLSSDKPHAHHYVPGSAAPAIPIGSGPLQGEDGSDVVTNILSPAQMKAGHNQLLNAIMHTNEGGTPDRPKSAGAQGANYLHVMSSKPTLPKEIEKTLDKVTKAITDLNNPEVGKDWKGKAMVVGGVTVAAVVLGFLLGGLNNDAPRRSSRRGAGALGGESETEEEGVVPRYVERVTYTDLPRKEALPEAKGRRNAPREVQRR